METISLNTLAFLTVTKTFSWKKFRPLRKTAKAVVMGLDQDTIRVLFFQGVQAGLIAAEHAKVTHKRRYVWMAVKALAFQAANENKVASLQFAAA